MAAALEFTKAAEAETLAHGPRVYMLNSRLKTEWPKGV
jgi:hypothetical protein